MHENCARCHYAFHHGVPTLDCRRHAPVKVAGSKSWDKGEYPQTDAHGWCGDFKAREDDAGNIPSWMLD